MKLHVNIRCCGYNWKSWSMSSEWKIGAAKSKINIRRRRRRKKATKTINHLIRSHLDGYCYIMLIASHFFVFFCKTFLMPIIFVFESLYLYSHWKCHFLILICCIYATNGQTNLWVLLFYSCPFQFAFAFALRAVFATSCLISLALVLSI